MIDYLLVPDYIGDLVVTLKDYFSKEPSLLEIKYDRVAIVGDTHGAIDVSSLAFDKLHEGYCVIMLGDLIDRGPESLRNLVFSMEMKFLTDKVFIIRGNHESSITPPYYGFLDELKENGIDYLYDDFLSMFASIPYGILLNEMILCLHGGIASGEFTLEDIRNLRKGDIVPDDKRGFEILWNDPREFIEGFLPSTRAEGAYFFGRDVFEHFMETNNLSHLIRGHEVKMNGIADNFNGKLITVFSSEYHGGKKGILILDNGKFIKIIRD
ncbi:MAG: metallophosphoesterase [Thermoplasmata archaeon]